MKLEFPKIDIKTSRAFESENFSLGDMRVIMTLLSEKIYARPKYIIVQEVASNARDANREVGRGDVPIQIKLPSRLDDNIIIADSGPGISPTRMSDVFLKYGESTKRSDNVLTGGFGIGAKTPFTYTDTFNVVTVTDDDDGKRRQRTYIAHKADNGFARMSLVDTKISTEDTGTAISFAVLKEDFDAFYTATREVCRFWKVRPTVTGVQKWTWPKEDILHEGKNWTFVSARNSAKVLIDGIPYNLRLETVFGHDRYSRNQSEAYKVLTHGSVRMYFKTGEIDVSATREDLDYKDRTIKAIKDRANECLAELRAKVSKAIEKCPSLYAASLQWHKDSSNFRQFLVQPKWKGKDLLLDSYGARGTVYTEDLKFYKSKKDLYISLRDWIKVTNFVKDGQSIVSKKSYGRMVDRYMRLNATTIIIEDDEGKARPNRLRLQTIFEKNPSITTVCVVHFKTSEGLAYAKEKWQWDEIPHTKLSSWAKAKKPKGPNGKTRTINAVKVLAASSAYRGWSEQWQPEPSRCPDDGNGGLYILLKNGKPLLSNGQHIAKEDVKSLFRAVDNKAPVIGILYKYRNKIDSSWTDVLTKAKEKLEELKKKPGVATYIKYGNAGENGILGTNVANTIRHSKGKLSDEGLITYLDVVKTANKATGAYNSYRSLASKIGEKTPVCKNEIAKYSKEIKDKYPLVEHFEKIFGGYYYSRDKTQDNMFKEELIFYLNAKHEAAEAASKES
jgi:hypothetical protein